MPPTGSELTTRYEILLSIRAPMFNVMLMMMTIIIIPAMRIFSIDSS